MLQLLSTRTIISFSHDLKGTDRHRFRPAVLFIECDRFAIIVPSFNQPEIRINSTVTSHHVVASEEGTIASLKAPSCQLSDHEILLEVVRRNLEQHATSVEIPYFVRPSLQLREIAPAFERISSYSALAATIKEIFWFAGSSPQRSNLVAFILPHLLLGCATKDKQKLLDLALKQPSKMLRNRMAYGIVRASQSREELFRILTPQRSEKLTQLGSRKLTELVAKAQVLRALQEISVPLSMWGKKFNANNASNRETARRRVKELGAAVAHGQQLLAQLGHLTHKARGSSPSGVGIPARPLYDAQRTLSSIARGVDKIQAGPRQPYSRIREFVTTSVRRLSLECSDGLRLLQSRTLPEKDLWTPNLVQKLLDAVHLIPERDRLMTPKLREFILAKVSVLGERRQSGRVAISYPGEIFNYKRSEYEGASALTSLIIHEVAHSIQMGHEGDTVSWDQATGEILSPNNPLIDLGGFLELSGWRTLGVYDKSEIIGGNAIRLFGTLYPLDRPVRVVLSPEEAEKYPDMAEWIVFRHGSNNLLFYHRVDAEFSLNSYSLSDPLEDFAEAFTEYTLCPDRLIECAPEKFYYMEIHFRAYLATGDYQRLTAVQQALRGRLGSRTTASAADLIAPERAGRGAIKEPPQGEFGFIKEPHRIHSDKPLST